MSEEVFRSQCIPKEYFLHVIEKSCSGLPLELEITPISESGPIKVSSMEIYVNFDDKLRIPAETKSIRIKGVLDEPGMLEQRTQLRHVVVVSTTGLSEEEIAKKKENEQKRKRKLDSSTQCLVAANRISRTGNFNCGWFAEPVYEERGDKLLLSMECKHKNAFGQEVKVVLSCVNSNGVTAVTSIE